MKVRWTKRSIRLRITPQELAQIENSQEIGESLFLNATRIWTVNVSWGETTTLISHGGEVTFHLSHHDIQKLCEPEREGVYFSQGDVLFYIEKDFPCAHPRAGEAEEIFTETFAAPVGFEERKNA